MPFPPLRAKQNILRSIHLLKVFFPPFFNLPLRIESVTAFTICRYFGMWFSIPISRGGIIMVAAVRYNSKVGSFN